MPYASRRLNFAELARLLAAFSVATAVTAQTYSRSYPPASPECGHQTGEVYDTTQWQAGVADPTNVFLTYGPYATDAPPSTSLVATWTIWVDNNVSFLPASSAGG